MKNNKKKSPMMKIVSAAAMLAVSASMLGTSTYAWFSMNKDVTVNGMSVTAKSDTAFLVVKQAALDNDANTVAALQSEAKITDTALTASAQLYPTAHDDIAATANISAIEATDTTNTTDKDIWYYKYSTDPDSSNTSVTSATYVPDASFDDYVLVNAFDLTVKNNGGGASISNLKVSSCTITASDSGDQAVKVLVAGPDGNAEFDGAGNANGSNNVICNSVTNAALSQVRVYVYWDGNDADVYTNGAADLKNTAVTVGFTGTIVNPTGA